MSQRNERNLFDLDGPLFMKLLDIKEKRTKVSDTEIRDGLEVAKAGEDFASYGETIVKKIS